MGWFGVAAILGALLWGLWHLNRPYTVEGQARIVVWSIVALIVGLILFAALFQQSLRPTWIADSIGHGRIARFLLGLAVGYATAYALHAGLIAGLNFLGLAVAIAILALAAPHLDRWLPHMTGIKTAVIELQFASNVTHKVAVAENQEAYAAETAFFVLTYYAERIQHDIDFIELIEIPEIKAKWLDPVRKQKLLNESQTFLDKTRKLKFVFDGLISPLAKCYTEAASKGASSLHRLHEILRPLARDAQQLVQNHQLIQTHKSKFQAQEEEVHERFWRGILMSAWLFDEWHAAWGSTPCAHIAARYWENHPGIAAAGEAYPKISEFSDLPYLYTAAATLLMTVREAEASLEVLEKARINVKDRWDYMLLALLAQAKLYQGRPASEIVEFFEKIRETAADRWKRVKQLCRSTACHATHEQLEKRHRAAEIVVMNDFVYRASEDLARGTPSAGLLEARMEAYANRLKEIVADDELRGLDLHDAVYEILDTYAYARIVLEARRPNPDVGVFRQMRRILQDVVGAFEEDDRKSPSRESRHRLNVARVHYQSARELARE